MRQLLKIKRLSKLPLNKKLVVGCSLCLQQQFMCGIFDSVLKRLIKDCHIEAVDTANKPEE